MVASEHNKNWNAKCSSDQIRHGGMATPEYNR
jgi:hypothetical protein